MATSHHRLNALVIADWRLPDGDGTQIADAAVERGMKAFVMSGYLLQVPVTAQSGTRRS